MREVLVETIEGEVDGGDDIAGVLDQRTEACHSISKPYTFRTRWRKPK